MKRIVILTLFMPFLVFAGGAPSAEKLAKAYVQAVNEKSVEKLKTLIHPDCVKQLNADEKRFFEEVWIQKEFRSKIPQDYRLHQTDLKEGTLPFIGTMVWKVRPAKEMQIDYNEGENSSKTIVRWTRLEGETVYFVVPFPSDEYMKKYREKPKP